MFTYNPTESTLAIEGGRLTSKVVRHVKRGNYFPVVFIGWEDSKIEIEFEWRVDYIVIRILFYIFSWNYFRLIWNLIFKKDSDFKTKIDEYLKF